MEKIYWSKDLKFGIGFSLVGSICLAIVSLGVVSFWPLILLGGGPSFFAGFLLANNLSNNKEIFINIFNNSILMSLLYSASIGIISVLAGIFLSPHPILNDPTILIKWISELPLLGLLGLPSILGALMFILLKRLL